MIVPVTVQFGVKTAFWNVSDEAESFHAVTTWLGPQVPSSEALTWALLMVSWVGVSAWPVHGVALVALPWISPHRPPPVKDVEVIVRIPVLVIVPLNVAVQFAVTEPFVSVVPPVAENGSPLGFSGLPSARETVTANAGAASADETARATTRKPLFE